MAISKLKPLLEWLVVIALAVGIGLGLAWSPLEKSVVQLGLLIVGSGLLAYVFYLVFQLSKLSDDDDFDMSNWPANSDDETPTNLEVKS